MLDSRIEVDAKCSSFSICRKLFGYQITNAVIGNLG
jgi:hypothetical protein